ncbi:UNVERIFIED_CONTAM: hypothetical protein Sindi_0716000 [Sesamum indicum]
MEACETNSNMLRLRHLRENLEELHRKVAMERLTGMTHELREHDPKYAFGVQSSRPVASNSSTDCTRPSSECGETTIIESQEVQTPVGSS